MWRWIGREVLPHPNPLPLGEGAMLPASGRNQSWITACELADFTKSTNGGSFSRREKVRMRGNADIKP